MPSSRRLLLTLLAALICAAPRFGDPAPGVEIEDAIDLIQVDRRIIAVNSANGAIINVDLELGESVIWTGSEGLVGVAATSVRLLGATAGSRRFHSLRYRVEERASPPQSGYVSERLALVPLAHRLVVLAAGSSAWAELTLGPNEKRLHTSVDANIAAVVTNRRAIAFAAKSGGFVEIVLSPQETLESISIEESSVTLITPRRVLVFRAGAGFWTDILRKNHR